MSGDGKAVARVDIRKRCKRRGLQQETFNT
jgi:hypothetical protein